MDHETVKHTLAIFDKLYGLVEPVLPLDMRKEMAHALRHIEDDATITLAEIEDTVIVFGKRVWPYRKAFLEILTLQEGDLGEKFLRAQLSREMKQKFDDFLASGHTFRDLRAGRGVSVFSSEERQELCVALVEFEQNMQETVAQQVHSTRKRDFEKQVKEFSGILEEIESNLEDLRKMADSEQDHPQLAEEIRDHVRGFELGLCALGPEIGYGAVCNAREHFEGRKHHLAKVRVRHL